MSCFLYLYNRFEYLSHLLEGQYGWWLVHILDGLAFLHPFPGSPLTSPSVGVLHSLCGYNISCWPIHSFKFLNLEMSFPLVSRWNLCILLILCKSSPSLYPRPFSFTLVYRNQLWFSPLVLTKIRCYDSWGVQSLVQRQKRSWRFDYKRRSGTG